jgi:hypothetical protein
LCINCYLKLIKINNLPLKKSLSIALFKKLIWLKSLYLFKKGHYPTPCLDFNFNKRQFHGVDPNLDLAKLGTSNLDTSQPNLELEPGQLHI